MPFGSSRPARFGWWGFAYRMRKAPAGRWNAVIGMLGGTEGAPAPRRPISNTTSSWTPRTARFRHWRASSTRGTRRVATQRRSTDSASASFLEPFDPNVAPRSEQTEYCWARERFRRRDRGRVVARHLDAA